ncbi:MAG TPA: SDR family oxidoreductase [Bacillota bacterium]|nr:SDR family oxidoreductase [Bacillota bacterium]HPZ22831.1 SDR family oxidoreductase [Bacillota bacterium]HQD20467.1 SDR family oxidoreductase [Bacillota bacterium]
MTNNKTAVVTGASRGIGYELSRLLARDGYNLILIARNEELLGQVARELEAEFNIKAYVLAQNLSDAMAGDQIAARIKELNLPIHILVNNAGFGCQGPFSKSNSVSNLEMILTNTVALTRLTQIFIPELVANKGKILNTSSQAAFQPVPYFAVYAATKAYVLSFSQALAEELKPKGVTVTALCPGVTKTDFIRRAGMEDTRAAQGKLISSRAVAEIGYRGMLGGKTVVVPGIKEKVMTAAGRVAPRRLVAKIAGSLMRDRG